MSTHHSPNSFDAAERSRQAPGRALIVDDNDLNRRLAGLFLTRLGWETDEAGDGQEALAAVRSRAYNLVLLDLRMPGMSGEQICGEMRQICGEALPIIAYTGHSTAEEHDRMMAVGFTGVLIKPVSFNDVRDLCAGLSAASRRV